MDDVIAYYQSKEVDNKSSKLRSTFSVILIIYVICEQVAGRLHVELMRISGVIPERLSGGDDSSENSSESSCYEVMDTNGEIVHMTKRLTCRVEGFFHLCTETQIFHKDMILEDKPMKQQHPSYILSLCHR